jgi:hypothetical protein
MVNLIGSERAILMATCLERNFFHNLGLMGNLKDPSRPIALLQGKYDVNLQFATS